jgi:hypothetical protein
MPPHACIAATAGTAAPSFPNQPPLKRGAIGLPKILNNDNLCSIVEIEDNDGIRPSKAARDEYTP